MSSDSQSQLFLVEAFDLLSNTAVLEVLYGIVLVLYCLCAQLLYGQLRGPDSQRQARFTLGYISLVFICTTALLIVNSRTAQLAYITHADFSGEPLEYELSGSLTTRSFEAATGIFDVTIEVLTMSIQTWRLWVIWSGTRYAVSVSILPLLLLLSYTGLQTLNSIVVCFAPLVQLNISEGTRTRLGIASYSIPSVFTILVTGLIITRLLLVRRRHLKIMGNASSPYAGIIAMLVESYTLDSAWSIAAAISNGFAVPVDLMFIDNDSVVKVIAYFLVVYRVASGRAWTRDTEHKLTTLQWDHHAQTTTDEASDVHSQAPKTAIVVIGSPSVSQAQSIV